jgi:hypothetical protein
MTEEIVKFIKKAKHVLKVAQDLLDYGYPSDLFIRKQYA